MSSADVSVITSLYRAQDHLADYILRMQKAAMKLRQAGVKLEVVQIANEATEWEDRILNDLARALEAAHTASVIRLDVARESLYASWNRGIAASSGRALAIWNVDDDRTAEGLIEGYHLISEGCEIVDFPFAAHKTIQWLGQFTTRHTRILPPRYDPANFGRKALVGPFFMFARTIYDAVGPFDPHFRIAGDFDWCARPAALAATYCHGKTSAGTFYLHGSNLSDTQNPQEEVEVAIVLLRQRRWHQLVPVGDTTLLKAAWHEWGDLGTHDIPSNIQDELWGPGARRRWKKWQRQRRRKTIMRAIRYIPRQIIDRTGLRPLLAALGIVRK